MRLLRRLLKTVGVLLVMAAAALVVLALALRHPRPAPGTPGDEADRLARAAARFANEEAWKRTGAVRWSMAGRREHLWDRARGLDRVRKGDLTVLLDLGTQRGRAFRGATELDGDAKHDALASAWKWWCNDSYWLNPLVKLFDDGVRREVVTLEGGERALMVSYASGGATPGDAYVWRLNGDGTPRSWRMYVSIIPVAGIESSWEEWLTLSTGARIATLHKASFVPIRLTGVAGAATLAELEPGPDPFASLAGGGQ